MTKPLKTKDPEALWAIRAKRMTKQRVGLATGTNFKKIEAGVILHDQISMWEATDNKFYRVLAVEPGPPRVAILVQLGAIFYPEETKCSPNPNKTLGKPFRRVIVDGGVLMRELYKSHPVVSYPDGLDVCEDDSVGLGVIIDASDKVHHLTGWY